MSNAMAIGVSTYAALRRSDPDRPVRLRRDFQGRKRVHNADEIMAEIVAKRLVEHLARRLRRHEAAAARERRGCLYH